MDRFSRERNGYSRKEVDEFLARLKLENEERLREQRDTIFELKSELSTLKGSLTGLTGKEKHISTALVSAVEKACEIEESARVLYELEIKRVRILYRKWEALLEKLMSKHGKCIVTDEITLLLNEFQQAIKTTLDSDSAKTALREDKSYAKTLLTRMGGTPNALSTARLATEVSSGKTGASGEAGGTLPKQLNQIKPMLSKTHEKFTETNVKAETKSVRNLTGNNLAQSEQPKAGRSYGITTAEALSKQEIEPGKAMAQQEVKAQYAEEVSRLAKSGSAGTEVTSAKEISKNSYSSQTLSKSSVSEVKTEEKRAITALSKNGSLADDFLTADEADLPKVFGKASKQNAFFDTIVPKPMQEYIKDKEEGFDLREAVNPTESLEEIMKAFDFYEEDSKTGS